ncbi:hypothetical protein Sste5346_000192 [Sporothrix stenoceras]|uniref:Zn(2)-C6 fungal-type domain-containing protein n=1 Tax=Sporothrix stenoceras TaxID=5173 RepID=A0ABR3ZSW1_9PEZI
MILGRSSKPRSRASIACAGCRARRTKCIIGEGQSSCDRCIRLSKTCVLRDDDERKRPVTKAQVHALVRRIGALEQRLSDAGLEIPPTLADDVATAAAMQTPRDQQNYGDDSDPRQRRTSMRDDVAAAVQGSVVSAAALVAAATGHGRNAAAQALGGGDGSRDMDSSSPPQHQQTHHYTSGTTPSSANGGSRSGSMWPPPPIHNTQDRSKTGHGSASRTDGSISGASTNGNGAVGSSSGPGMMMDETDSPASTVASSDMASSAMYSESDQRRRLRSGSMSNMGPRGHSRYIGITTNYHIYSNMYHAEKEETRRERENNAARTREFLANIPFEAHRHLINQFWSCYNTIIHIVHRRAFELDSGMMMGGGSSENNGNGSDSNREPEMVPGAGSSNTGSGSYYSPFLHVCMLSIGYRYSDRTRADVQAFATPDGESLLHEEAKRLVDSELQMPGGIPSLQALLLLGDLECGVGRYNTGWLYAGMACRLIFDLGLNRQIGQAGQSRLDMEVKRTVLWGCVVLDRFWGLFLGRPTSIKIADITISNSPTKPRPMQGCLPMGPQCRFETEIYDALINLTDTASKLTDAAHRHYTTSDPSAYYFVTGLHRELRNWYKHLPPRLQWTPANLARDPPSAFFNLHQQYHTMYILMYRPFLSAGKATPAGTHNTGGGQTNGNPEPAPSRNNGGNGGPYEDVFEDSGATDEGDDNDDGMDPELGTDIVTEMARKMCFAHAIEVARIYEAFCARFECRSMFVTGMQHAATAAFAIVEGLATQSSDKQAETLLHLQRLAEALYAHASVYYPARVMSNILFRVLGEYRDNHARQAAQQQQQQQHNQQNEQQHNQQYQQSQQQQPLPHAQTHAHHMHHQSIDMADANTAQPATIAPAWTTTSTSPGTMKPPPVPGQGGHMATGTGVPVPGATSGHSDWTGLMHNNGHDDVRGAHGTMMEGPMVSGTGPNNFVDFEFDSGIWESIMNTLSQPLDLGA